MKLVSLFAGIGGFDIGFEQAGFQSVGQVEIDPWCQEVLSRHWPNTAKHTDITTAHGMMFGPAEVITFGSPCQDLSVAGKRGGLGGARSGLFTEAVRFIREMREGTDGRYPEYAVWENVPGAFSSGAGRDFAMVLKLMAQLGARDLAWRVLDSRHFGVPQRRRRIFLVADFRGERAAKVLFESEGVRRNPAPRREPGQDVAACLTSGTYDRGDGADNLIPVAVAVRNLEPIAFDHKGIHVNVGESSPTLRARENQGGGLAAVCFQQNQRDEVRLMGGDGQTAGALAAEPGMKQQNYVATIQHAAIGRKDSAGPRGKGWRDDGLSFTLDAMGAADVVATSYAVRRLTPVETERLQGFPDDWTRYSETGAEIADTHRYRMAGNAVTVPVTKWIAQQMVAA